jgi:hypothetical protein
MGSASTSDLETEDEATRQIIREKLFVDPPTEFSYLTNESRIAKVKSEVILSS